MAALAKIGALVLGASALSGSAVKAADIANYILRGSDLPVASAPYRGLNEGFEFGTRVWYSTGTIGKTLYTGPASSMEAVSRLTYTNLNALSGEAFGRIGVYGWGFFKGDVGLGRIGQGALQDEDFEPFMVPYSSTTSAQSGGSLEYGSLDYGFDVLQQPTYRLGVIVGASYLNQTVNGYGCTQNATNTFICAVGDVAPGALAITENARWISLRLGLSGDVMVSNRFRLGVDAAWLPFSWFDALDTHWLRTDIGPTPEVGNGRNGVELEATASYRLTENFSLGAGVRYWRLTATPGARFVDQAGNSLGTQPETFMTQRYGTFVQAAYSF